MRTMVRCILVFVVWCGCAASVASAEPINAVIGDESWVATHGGEPVEGVDVEVERIQTHLRFVLERLRASSGLPLEDARFARRHALLDALEVYTEAGSFPQRNLSDGWGVRRPQFIDDAGVHCAVGDLIRVSGHPKLALSLDRVHEFDFVEDMNSRELFAWATHHGFSLRELAMIQPGYYSPPPSPKPPRRTLYPNLKRVKRVSSLLARRSFAECAAMGSPRRKVKVRVHGVEGDEWKVDLVHPKGAFAECVASMLQRRMGRLGVSATVFRHNVSVDFSTDQEFMERNLASVPFHDANSKCLPGNATRENPKKVSVLLVSNAKEARVEVKTIPEMPDVQTCIQEYVRKAVGLRVAHWKVNVTQERKVVSYMNDDHLKATLERSARRATTTCRATDAPFKEVTVRARASRIKSAIAIDVVGGSRVFKWCVEAKIHHEFSMWFRRHVELEDGSMVTESTIDDDATAEVSFEVETQGQYRARIEKERERQKNQRLEASRERARQRALFWGR